MKLYYQWLPWAYSNIVANYYWDKINILENDWLLTFKDVFDKISEWNLWIIPIENSYAWSVYENFFHLYNYDIEIYSEYYQDINHCLVSKASDKSQVKKVISHYQAIMQCEKYIKKNWFDYWMFSDTAWSAEYISKNDDFTIWSICSELAGNIYWLNILDKFIQDQNWNKTRFFLVWKKWSSFDLKPSNKISLIFKAKDIPASLYKCLWSFATRNINLSKIESLPAKDSCFEYMFWIDVNWSLKDENVVCALNELKFFTSKITILWSY